MKIVVNTRLLIHNQLEGIGRFSFETLSRITKAHPNDHFVFLFDRKFSEEFIFSNNITPVVLSPQARHPILFWIWFEYSVKNILRDLKPDLFLSPDGFLSLGSPVKQLPVIHDINFEHHPEFTPFLARKYYRHFFPRFARKAARIATVSEFSKLDIARSYGVDLKNIDVVGNAASEVYRPLTEEEKKHTREKYSDSAEYFVYVGSLQPRKNMIHLLKAFDEFKKSHLSNIQLLLVGQKRWWSNEMEAAYTEMQFRNDVVFTGPLSPEELKNVLASALALTYVPFFEGFGIPIVEAMYCGVPVITSNVTSMPEVSGEAALLVDPFSVDSIKSAMVLMAKDEQIRSSLVERGKVQRQKYSWDFSAEKLWQSIERC